MFFGKKHVSRGTRLPGRQRIRRSHYLADGIFYAEDREGTGWYLVSALHIGKLTKITRGLARPAGGYLCFARAHYPLLLIELKNELWHLWAVCPDICRHLVFTYNVPSGYLPQSPGFIKELFAEARRQN